MIVCFDSLAINMLSLIRIKNSIKLNHFILFYLILLLCHDNQEQVVKVKTGLIVQEALSLIAH
jgi:hypothetical protein